MTALKIDPQDWLIAAIIAGYDDNRHLPLPWFAHTLFPVSPGSTGHESGEFLLWRNAERRNVLRLLQAAQRWQVKEPEAFSPSARPQHSSGSPTIIPSVWEHGCGRGDDGNVCGSVSRRQLDVATWKLAGGRGLWWSLWLSGREQRKKSILSFSQCFFFVLIMDSFDEAVWIRVVERSACDQLHLFLTDE